MTQPQQVGDHQVMISQAEKHQVPQVQQQAQQQEPWYQVPQVQQRAQQQEPRCPSSCGTEQQRYVLPVQMSQAEKHQVPQVQQHAQQQELRQPVP